jgi:hypothetical protein
MSKVEKIHFKVIRDIVWIFKSGFLPYPRKVIVFQDFPSCLEAFIPGTERCPCQPMERGV